MTCPDCSCNDTVIEVYESMADCFGYTDCGERGRCHNCGYRGDVEEFAGEESMDEEQTERTISAAEQALVLIHNIQQHEEQKAALIASLKAERLKIDEALVALGVKPRGRPSGQKKRGRPVGSRNKTAPNAPVAIAPTAAQTEGL